MFRGSAANTAATDADSAHSLSAFLVHNAA